MKTTMKKQYEIPVSEEIRIQMAGMIAQSPGIGGGQTPGEEPIVNE